MKVRALISRLDGASKSSSIGEVDSSELGEGDVTVRVEWSTVNFKDGNALTHDKVMKRSPLVGGIDLAGVVEQSDNPLFSPGDRVLSNGQELSMSHHGGYAELARVPADWLIPVPAAFSTRQSMAVGTAGYTAMLCVMALERQGVTPEAGRVLVTGAAGGVGSIAIAILSELGYTVTASTGRAQLTDYLLSLGASEVVDRSALSDTGSPMGEELWAGAVDSVGSTTLATVISQMRYGGVIAACGLAKGSDLPTSVSPFLARNLSLLGIDSVRAPRTLRLEAWSRLAGVLDARKLDSTITEVALADVPAVARQILEGTVRGRTVVSVAS